MLDRLTCDIMEEMSYTCGQFVRPLFIALFVQSFVHLDDWLWISYSTHIFGKYGLSTGRAQRASLLMSLPQAVISISLLTCFESFSRRSLLIVPTIFSVFIGLSGIIVINFMKSFLDFPVGVMLAILASFDLCAAAVSGESAYAIVAELFLPNDKILGTAIVGIFQNLFGGLLTAILLSAVNRAGTSSVLIPFVAMNILYVTINYFYLPETGKKSAHEVAEQFSEELPGKALIDDAQRLTRRIWKEFSFSPTTPFHAFALIAQIGCLILLLRTGIHFLWLVAAYWLQ